MVLPTRSDPIPSRIRPQSSNNDVRRYVADLLQRIDADITTERSWEMAERFFGDGYDALELDRKEWEKLFGETHGNLVYKRFVRFQNEYVDVNFRRIQYGPTSDISIGFSSFFWSFIQGGLISEREAFTIDRGWNIAALVYFICYGFAYIFASANSIDDNPSWPTYFKIRPMGPTQKSWRSTLGYGGYRKPNSAPFSPRQRVSMIGETLRISGEPAICTSTCDYRDEKRWSLI